MKYNTSSGTHTLKKYTQTYN